MKASMFMDRDGIHSPATSMKVKKRRGNATARPTARGADADAAIRHLLELRYLTYASTFAASATTSWRAAVAAVSGVPALTTPNFGDHAASKT